jgi:hypothetical protein
MSNPSLGRLIVLILVLGIFGCTKKQPAAPPPAPAPQSVTPATPEEPTPPPPRRSVPRPDPPKPASPPVESPRLGALLTPEQQHDQNIRIDHSLEDASKSLGTVEKRTLSPAQQAAVAQIRGFMAQAEQLRKSDLTGARSLAERAQLLARDLLNSLR